MLEDLRGSFNSRRAVVHALSIAHISTMHERNKKECSGFFGY